MKRSVFVFGLVAIFLAGSVVISQEQNQGQSAEQAQGQSQWSAGTGSSVNQNEIGVENNTTVQTSLSTSTSTSTSNSTDVKTSNIGGSQSIISNYTQRTQPFGPGYAPYPFMFPNEYDYWNGYGSDLAIYERVWTREELENILANAREKGPLEGIASAFSGGAKNGYGFKYQLGALSEYSGPQKNEVEFVLQPPRPVPNDPPSVVEEKWKALKEYRENLKKFHLGGELGVRGKKDERIMFQTFAFALLLAMNNGADYVVGSPGLNPVYHGTSLGTGSGLGTSGVTNSFSLIGGGNVGDAKTIGEMIIRATFYRKNGVKNVSANLSGPERKARSESKALFETTPYGPSPKISTPAMKRAYDASQP